MNRYVVFGGDYYYPCGGWSDFRAAYPAKEDALEEAKRLVAHEEVTVGSYTYNRAECDWVQVVDMDEQVIIADGQKEDK